MSNSSDKDKADRGNNTAPDAPYEAGNKKPPRHTQFKPGFSGNPNGRPKGSVNLRTRVRQGLRKSIVVTKNGRPTRMPVLDVIANRLLEFVDEGRPQGDPMGRSVRSGGDGERDGKARRG